MEEVAPEEVLRFKHTEPNKIPVSVKGVPSKFFYLPLNTTVRTEPSKIYLSPLALIFRLGELECGISYKSIVETAKSLGEYPYYFQRFSLFRIRGDLEIIERENMPIEFVGKYDTQYDIFEVDYTKTIHNVEKAIDRWHRKNQEAIRLMKKQT